MSRGNRRAVHDCGAKRGAHGLARKANRSVQSGHGTDLCIVGPRRPCAKFIPLVRMNYQAFSMAEVNLIITDASERCCLTADVYVGVGLRACCGHFYGAHTWGDLGCDPVPALVIPN